MLPLASRHRTRAMDPSPTAPRRCGSRVSAGGREAVEVRGGSEGGRAGQSGAAVDMGGARASREASGVSHDFPMYR